MVQADGNTSSSDEEVAEPTRDETSEPLASPPEKIDDDDVVIVESQEAPPSEITKTASVSKSGSQKIRDLQLELYRLHQEIKRRSSTQVLFRNF